MNQKLQGILDPPLDSLDDALRKPVFEGLRKRETEASLARRCARRRLVRRQFRGRRGILDARRRRRNEAIYEVEHRLEGLPDPCLDSHFEYGARAGWWRVMELFDSYGVKATVSACGRAVERHAALARTRCDAGTNRRPWLAVEIPCGHERGRGTSSASPGRSPPSPRRPACAPSDGTPARRPRLTRAPAGRGGWLSLRQRRLQ